MKFEAGQTYCIGGKQITILERSAKTLKFRALDGRTYRVKIHQVGEREHIWLGRERWQAGEELFIRVPL